MLLDGYDSNVGFDAVHKHSDSNNGSWFDKSLGAYSVNDGVFTSYVAYDSSKSNWLCTTISFYYIAPVTGYYTLNPLSYYVSAFSRDSSGKYLTSRKIGGFHFGKCRKSLSVSDVYDGIVPASVWTLLWRPACSPEAMVYIGGGTWLDIYINSDDANSGLLSKYNATPITGTEGLNWYIAQERLRRVGKRMPSYGEWCKGAEGSPQGLDASNANGWTATSNTARQLTGYVANATSLLGLRDCAGNVWEWLDELCLDPTASSWNWYDVVPGYGQIYMPSNTALRALVAGGSWLHGAHCGARAVDCSDYPWNVDTGVGVRGACDAV